MTERSGLTRRTFARRFQAATGRRPIDYVHAVRIEGARLRLETWAGVDDMGFEGVRGSDLLPPALQADHGPHAGRVPSEVRPDRRSPIGTRTAVEPILVVHRADFALFGSPRSIGEKPNRRVLVLPRNV